MYTISSRYFSTWPSFDIKHVKNRHCSLFSVHVISPSFLTDFNASNGVLGPFLCSLRKSDLKTCIAGLNPEIAWFDPVYLVT